MEPFDEEELYNEDKEEEEEGAEGTQGQWVVSEGHWCLGIWTKVLPHAAFYWLLQLIV